MNQAMAFFEQYKKFRFEQLSSSKNSENKETGLSGSPLQEIYYNIGRSWHQIGFRDMALQYYRLALNETPLKSSDLKEGESNQLDLSGEIAYNMASIYKLTGNMRLANQVLIRYCSC